MTDTLLYALDETLPPQQPQAPMASAAPAATRRTTVLPRVEWRGDRPDVVPLQRERFEEVGALGQGGMGEVLLLKDHDIERNVALKRLTESGDLDRVLRFVEEIRIVGQLDHPNIVPVHDVGVDEQGRYYFMMKHLQGETLESIIDRLRQGDAEAHARYTFAARVQIFIGVLNAVDYAHRKGFIHRDLKPANIMVGPFGEVTVMDWGLARRVRAPAAAPSSSPQPPPPASLREAASMQTYAGALLGTPMYMSPEQARGEQDALDARSDLYSLCVLFHELLYLTHYLEGRQSLAEVLTGVQEAEPNLFAPTSHPSQGPVPAEFGWFLHVGMKKNPAERYPSTEAVLKELRKLAEGHIPVRCHRTLAKRTLHTLLHFVDAHPIIVILGMTLGAALLLGTLVRGVLQLLG